MSNLLDKLLKNSTIKETGILSESRSFTGGDVISTEVPLINLALSGSPTGGLTAGLTMLAGPSKHFKTAFSLLMIGSYLKKYPDAICLFYDSEFGSPPAYFANFGIDANRVIHTPITDVEILKHDIMNQLAEITREDKVIVFIDSIGNLASKKEVDDALDGKNVADMTRAKAIKSLFRMITPHLSIKDVPMVVVNHTYASMDKYTPQTVSGGSGIYYSASSIWIIGRQQDKEDKDDDKKITGYRFIINVDKSRYVREKSKIPISVSWEGGINKWSGMFDLALSGGYIKKITAQTYQRMDPETGELHDSKARKKKDLVNNHEFWEQLVSETDFYEQLERHFSIENSNVTEATDKELFEEIEQLETPLAVEYTPDPD